MTMPSFKQPPKMRSLILLKTTMGIRATREEELAGLDVPEHGIQTYPELPQPAEATPA